LKGSRVILPKCKRIRYGSGRRTSRSVMGMRNSVVTKAQTGTGLPWSSHEVTTGNLKVF